MVIAAAFLAVAAVTVGAAPASAFDPPTPGSWGESSAYVAVDPVRVATVRIGAGEFREIEVAAPSLPAGTATAVALNVTVSGITQPTFVSVCADGMREGDCTRTSTVNPYPGRDVANFTVTGLPGPSRVQEVVDVYNDRGSVTVSIDLVGYFRVAAGYETSMFRMVDPYRDGDVLRLGPGETASVALDRLPEDARAVGIRAIASGVTASTYVSVCPGDQDPGACRRTSTLNPAAGRDTSNLAFVSLGGEERDLIQVYNDRGWLTLQLDVVVQMVPYSYPASRTPDSVLFSAVVPTRSSEPWVLDPSTSSVDVAYSFGYSAYPALFINATTSGNTDVSYVSACGVTTAYEDCLRTSVVNSYPDQDTASSTVVPFVTFDPYQPAEYRLALNRGRSIVQVDLLGVFRTEY